FNAIAQLLPKTASQAVRNTNVIKPGMYRIATSTTQTKTPQLPQTSRNSNPRVSTSTRVNHMKFKKTQVEDHRRISSISKKTKSGTTYDDSLKSRTSNVNAVCATCGKWVINSIHDACVSKYLNDVNARTKKPSVVPISASKPKNKANKSVATPHKKTVALDINIQKSKSYYRELYENTNQAWKWWIEKQCPSGYKWTPKPPKIKKKWMPKIGKEKVSTSISLTIDIVSRITNVLKISNSLGSNFSTVPSSSNSLAYCSTHPIYCTVPFGNDQFPPILGYGDLIQGNVMIKRGNDLLTGNRGSDLYTISLQESTSATPICFMAKASPTQAWLWHRRLSHLNFDYINLLSKKDVVIGLPKLNFFKDQLCSSCEVSKEKRSSFKTKAIPSSKGRLNLLHMDLCADKTYSSQQELEFLFSPLFEEYFSAGNSSVKKSSSLTDNSKQQETQPTVNVQQPTTPTTNVIAKEKNTNDQAEIQEGDAQIDENEFYNIFSTLVREEAESSTRYVDPSNMDTFYQPHQSEHRWTKDHPLEQVRGNPSKPVQTRRQLATDPKMCMFALTVSTAEPKNIKEAMADLAWIEGHFWRDTVPRCIKLVSWMQSKQTALNVLREAEYVALSASCAQVMWMRTQLKDYGFNYNKIPLYCDSQSAIAISCKPLQHSGQSTFYTGYHFKKEHVENGIIELYFVRTEYQLADMFTKALSEDRFKYLVRRIGMRCLTPVDLEVLTNETA
ncbi:retrovirus-related pol polyprotein from transposon TNT 1-94, partial [Tanacetum coccineum]